MAWHLHLKLQNEHCLPGPPIAGLLSSSVTSFPRSQHPRVHVLCLYPSELLIQGPEDHFLLNLT